jgi:G:T-mismatch repair DNA endonuclease (very short patch repair protein)
MANEKVTWARKKLWQNEEYAKRMFKALGIRPNNPETILSNLIKENNLPFNYVGDGAVWFRGENHSFNPDFLSKNPKHIIELFGDYWHNREDSKKRDTERLKTYYHYGYKTLIIWEHELKNPNQVIEKIKIFVS